jgi:hypothetical protein
MTPRQISLEHCDARESRVAKDLLPMNLPSSRQSLGLWLWGLLLTAAHVALSNYFVPFAKVFGPRPLTGADYDLHVGQVLRVVEGLEGWGKSWVYDVHLVAGQPEGTITDSGSKAWELWTYALHQCGAPFPIAFNTFVLMIMLTCPLIVFAASRTFQFSVPASLAAATFASCAWFFDSYMHWIWWVGMISWAGACCLSLLTLALFYRLVATQRIGWAIPAGLCLGVGHLLHPYSFFVLLPPMAAVYLRGLRSRPRKIHLAVVGMGVFTFAINLFWLRVSLAHWHYILDSGFFARGGIMYWVSDFFGLLLGADTGVIGVRSGFRILFLAFALAWLVTAHTKADPRVLPLAVAIGSSLALAYLLAQLPGGRQVQPYRNLPPAILLSTMPAAAFVLELAHQYAWRDLGLATRGLILAVAVALFQSLSGQVLYFFPRLLPVPDRFSDGLAFPLSVYGFLSFSPIDNLHYGLPHDETIEGGAQQTIDWLQARVPAGSRLLVEGAALGERLAWSSPFEVIGGFRERNVSHAYANYFRSFEKHPANPQQLAKYLHTFGIGWIILMLDHPEFNAREVVQPVTRLGGYSIYRTVAPVTRVLEGHGTVRAQTNSIDVSDTDPNQVVVLSYHVHEALRCAPNCRIERQTNPLDRVGFIRIPAPHPAAFRISNSYRMRDDQR